MPTFVLVPGAWLGGWCWQEVTPGLRQAGHQVYTPTLTGLGERRHLGGPQVDLDTHIQDIVNVLEFEDLRDVILLGHSYSGMVITGVAERVPERLTRLVYLSATVPGDGQSVYDASPPQFREVVEAQAREHGDGWRWPLPPADELDQFMTLEGFTDDDKRWVWSKATPQPIATYAQPLRVNNPAAQAIPHSYIYGTLDVPLPIVEHARTSPDWDFHELPAGHWAMVTHPSELAALLASLAAAR
jgi:pimeloyl-ACP methyl ester carboxylesterase